MLKLLLCSNEKSKKRDDNNELIKQLVDENSNLKTNLETSACMMSFQSEEIKNLTANRTNELNNKLQRKALKNNELISKLATSRDKALTITDKFHETESKLEKEINKLKNQLLNRKQKILEEKEVILNSTLYRPKRLPMRKSRRCTNRSSNLNYHIRKIWF
jgi:hypothetical protein